MNKATVKHQTKRVLRKMRMLEPAKNAYSRTRKIYTKGRAKLSLGSAAYSNQPKLDLSAMLAKEYFDPTRIAANRNIERPNSNFAGRISAEVGNQNYAASALSALLYYPDTQIRQNVFVVGNGLEKVLQGEDSQDEGLAVTKIVPGVNTDIFNLGGSYLFIDLLGIENSAWAGVFSATKSNLAKQLCTILEWANKRGVVTVFVGGSVPSQYTNKIKELCAVQLPDDYDTEQWHLLELLPLIRLAARYQRGELQ